MNFNNVFEATCARIRESGEKPRLLLHACCAPCSSSVLERLADCFSVTIFYYNPNIYPAAEYERRLAELKRFLSAFTGGAAPLIEAPYDPAEFYDAIGIKDEPALADERERGTRCFRCYRMRLERAAREASSGGYEWFCTTLSVSPYKDADKINRIGEELAAAGEGARWLSSDFKKRGGYLRSLALSREYGLYRQQYCGCEFSRAKSAARADVSRRREPPAPGSSV